MKLDKLTRLRNKILRILAERGSAFDAPKVPDPCVAPLTGIKWVEKLIGYFSCPMAILRQWTAVIHTDQGSYQMVPSCICRDRDTGRIDITFGPIDSTRLVSVGEVFIFNENDLCIKKESFVALILQCGDKCQIIHTLTI